MKLLSLLSSLYKRSIKTPEGSSALTASYGKSEHAFHGWVGLFSNRRVRGWVADGNNLNDKLKVRLQIDEYVSQPVIANEYRDHLAGKKFGDARFGFSFDVPDEVELSERSVVTVKLGSKEVVLLTKELKSYGAELPSLIGYNSAANLTVDPVKLNSKARFPRDRQQNVALLWAPISTSGLTVQLEQVCEILARHKFQFVISYHRRPAVDHPLCEHWIDPCDIDRPKLAIFFERFVEFDRGFDSSLIVFYMNLDWLSESMLPKVRTHADVVLCPTKYRIGKYEQVFQNSKVIHLPWPSKFKPTFEKRDLDDTSKIRVLYVGNDYDKASRKSPFEVIEAIENTERTDVVFDVKFRSALPSDVRNRLLENPRVDRLVDAATEHKFVQELYNDADVNLIPNACEGNGLSILEAWSSGTVPAVLNGHPMIDITSSENSYRINCEKIGDKNHAPFYRTSADNILDFINSLNLTEVRKKQAAVENLNEDMLRRQTYLDEVIYSCAMMSGLRTQGLRLRVEEAHLKRKSDVDWSPRNGDRVKSLLFSENQVSKVRKKTELIDVILTTSNRSWSLNRSLSRLVEAMSASPFEHRLFVAVDKVDTDTLKTLEDFGASIDQLLITSSQQGLPYMWNSMNDLMLNTISRTERAPDYVCYIQDDCLIKDPDVYFSTLAGLADEVMPGYLGYLSGFYTEVHPGFADFEWNGLDVVASDSIDGKNFFAKPNVLRSISPLTWWFNDGQRRGNPGPERGSHFDLWQWKESPNSLTSQSRISLIIPSLCEHIAQTSEQSTWNNDTTEKSVSDRVVEDRVYQTRAYD